MDFMAGLVSGGHASGLVEGAFDAALGCGGYLEKDLGETVVAAAAVLDSALNGTVYRYRGLEWNDPGVPGDEMYAKWVASLVFPGVSGLAASAAAALERIAGDGSELAELWDEAGDRGLWRRRVLELAARLSV
jgi:hypothetical protein